MRYPSRSRDGWGYGVFSAAGLVTQAWKFFALIALRLPKVCDRSHKNLLRSLGGPLPAWQRFSFNPARPFTAVLAGECPLYARAIVIFFLAAYGNAATFLAFFPCFSSRSGASAHS